ncbi:hypothetical protein Agub_g6812, partial [Astrephomene gubernaculifera]
MLSRRPASLPLSKQLAPPCFPACFRVSRYRRNLSAKAMSNYAHGLCVWPTAGALPAASSTGFLKVLPADLAQLQQWVSTSPRNLLTVIIALPHWDFRLISALTYISRTCFIVVWHPDATEDPIARIKAFEAGARMVTNDEEHLQEALRLITGVHGNGNLQCPWCGLSGLSTLELWQHQPLYHIYELDKGNVACPACSKPTSRLTRHINLTHGPAPLVDERTGVFALAIIRRPSDGKFLLVQVTGILTVESLRRGMWRRIIFLAEP